MIYLDYAATAPLRKGVRTRLAELLTLPLGNASSLHRQGHRARMLLEEARESIARALCAKVEEVVLTSGATEANNLAVLGLARMHSPRSEAAQILVSAIEHPSVWDPAQSLARAGYGVHILPVNSAGEIRLEAVEQLLGPETLLISVMAASNEVGTLQPISALAALRDRLAPKACLHVDAVQSASTARAAILDTRVDLLSLSAHKLGGPVGSGCLVVRRGLVLEPLLRGGSQEDNRRAGTSNVVATVGLATALSETPANDHVLEELRSGFEQQVAAIPGAVLLGQGAHRAPHISAWLFEGVAAEPLLVRLDLAGVAASSGSACSSHSLEPSRTVLAMGFSALEAKALIRFSLGHETTAGELERAAAVLSQSVKEVQRLK